MNSRRLRYTRHAQDDLDAILEYIVRDSPERGESFLRQMRASFQGQADAGLTGHTADHIFLGCRVYIYRRYVAVLRVTANAIEVVHVFHGARHIPALMEEDI